jgi:hypothetical protein
MPIPRFMLADYTADQLAQELVARIPAHTPDWRNPRTGDPGRTLIDLFGWLGETLLYRVNLIPARQRLEFLRLLNIPLQPARPARGLVALGPASPKGAAATPVPPGTPLTGPVGFETTGPILVQPFEGRVHVKRRPSEAERGRLSGVIAGLESIYGVSASDPYITTALFAGGKAVPEGTDPVADSIDGTIWIALLATGPAPEDIATARQALAGQPAMLNIGVVPRLVLPDPDPAAPAVLPPDLFEWSITAKRRVGGVEQDTYLALPVEQDTTAMFSREGTLRLVLPPPEVVGFPVNDVGADVEAGVGDRPPRLDDPDAAGRLVAWLRLRPRGGDGRLPLSWLGINAVAVDQRRTLANILAGVSDGSADQVVKLPAEAVDPASLAVEVQEASRGFVPWQRVEDLGERGRDDRVYALDAEAGTITFGNGVAGRVPETGARIRLVLLRAGGGAAGNLPAGSIGAIQQARLVCGQPAPTSGGADAETLEAAERRITAVLRHQNRCVTEDDYRALAAEMDVARVEVLPRFRPFQRRFDSPGTVSVLVLPPKPVIQPANPRPDRPLIERVKAHLDARRPLATELYAIGPEYRRCGASVAIGIRDGFAREDVVKAVRQAIFTFLWPLAPGGRDGTGWPLNQAVVNLEIEVVAARVPGVRTTQGVNLFLLDGASYDPVPASGQTQRIALEPWQLPELLRVDVAVDAPGPAGGLPDEAAASAGAVAIPVVPEMCT